MPTRTAAPPRTTLTVAAADLKAAAAWAAPIIPARPSVAILGGVILEATDGVLSLSAFDYETYSSIAIPVDGDLDRVLVHGRLLAEAAARLNGATRIELDGSNLVLTAGRASFRLQIMPTDDYPDVPPQAPTRGTIAGDTLAESVAYASVCVCRDAGLPKLLGIRLQAVGDTLTLWSTDRYRAARITTPWSGVDFDIVIAGTALSGALKGMHGQVDVGVDHQRITLTGPDRTVTITSLAAAATAEGVDYPDLRRLYPDTDSHVHVARTDLADAIAATRISVEDKQPIILEVTEDQVVVTGTSHRSTARAEFDAAGDTAIRWQFSPNYLAEITAATPGPRVRIEGALGGARPESKPVAIYGADADGTAIADVTYLLVPIRSAS